MKKTPVIHPFLFAIYPVLFLFANNVEHFPLKVTFTPAAVITGFSLLFWSLLSFILKDKKKAGLIVSLFLLLFFSYGHFYDVFKEGHFIIWEIGHKVMFSIWGVLFLVGGYFSIRTHNNLHNFTNILNIVAASLIAISVFNVGVYQFGTSASLHNNKNKGNIETNRVHLERAARPPNIYYIILDGYARADILNEMYDYDNTEFINYLKQKGFYVANKSRSNYVQTALSLAASLNFNYVDNLFDNIDTESNDRTPLTNIISNNRACLLLQQQGYKFVVYPSGYAATESDKADIYLTGGWFFNEFQQGLIETTPIPAVLKRESFDLHRERVLYPLEHLADSCKLEAPIFVFAHILSPHPPFVFRANGEEINPKLKYAIAHMDGNYLITKEKQNAEGYLTKDEYIRQYREQLIFITTKIKLAIDALLSTSIQPPIIILQSDHGPASMLDWGDLTNTNLKERLSILNAYYFPDQNYSELYDDITPVNTFRIIFNRYFGTNYELLKDESYFSTWGQPYKLIRIHLKSIVRGGKFLHNWQDTNQMECFCHDYTGGAV